MVTVFDVAIVGGGPAGLSAALVLGRCRRRVLLCDAGEPRNARSRELHGFVTRDGIPPLDLLRAGREELRAYGIEFRAVAVTGIDRTAHGFDVTLSDATRLPARAVLIAAGVRDHLPPIDGIGACYGVTAHHCPYCDGWEVRDKALAVIGNGAAAVALALSLKTWSDRVSLCLNGRSGMRPPHREQLARHVIPVHESRIARIEHENGHTRSVVLASGEHIECGAVFLAMRQTPRSDFAQQLGCEVTRRGLVKTDRLGRTCVPGVYVAGDASRDVQFAIVAAAEGAKAAVAINRELQATAGLAAAS